VLGNLALNGQERGNIQVFNALKEAGVEATFVTHSEWGHHHIQPLLDRLGLRWTTLAFPYHFRKGIGLRDWAKNLRRLTSASWAFWKTMRRYRPTHVHLANPHYALSALPALFVTRTPAIYRLGDEPPQHHVLYRLLWRWGIVPRVETFVCVSEYVREKAVGAGVPPEKTRVIYSYPPERPASARPALEENSFSGRTVVYVGQISPHKGVDLLVEVATALCRAREDVRFLIVGTIAKQNLFGVGLLGRVQQLGLAERIRFLGYVEDVPGLLAQADVHVCPSVWEEPLSNTVPEAKLAGVPSVVFPSGGLPELVTHGEDGYLCPEKSAQVLREGIEHFLDMEEEALLHAGEAARASLIPLSITKEGFVEAWGQVYGVSEFPVGRPEAAAVIDTEGVR
jgi:glycosyltransferase involved in cell wall biosynthesis